jgi:hypothetical protein
MFFEGVSGGCGVRRVAFKNNGNGESIGPDPDTGSIGVASDVNCANLRVTCSDATLGTGVRGFVSRNIFDSTLSETTQRGRLLIFDDHEAHHHYDRAWDAEDNLFILRGTADSRVGGRDKTDPATTPLWQRDIHFRRNEYRRASTTAAYHIWDDASGGGIAKTKAQWQAYGHEWQAYGHDPEPGAIWTTI